MGLLIYAIDNHLYSMHRVAYFLGKIGPQLSPPVSSGRQLVLSNFPNKISGLWPFGDQETTFFNIITKIHC